MAQTDFPHPHSLRRIDHFVVAARDLDGLAAFFRQLGFIVGARNRHPWGTHNHIVQFADCFIELLGADKDFHVAADADPHAFSFAGFAARYLDRRSAGGAMLALTSGNAAADARLFAAAGLGEFAPFHFERRAKRADGGAAEVAFTLAFARSADMPDAGFFSCQHHFPENFWNSAFQDHANGAVGLSAIVMIAENPADHGAFLSHLMGVRDFAASSLGLSFELGEAGQRLDVLTPLAFRQKHGAAALAQDAADPAFAACVVACRDRAALVAALEGSRTPYAEAGGHIVLPPSVSFGIALIFKTI